MSMTKEEAITNLENLVALFYTESEQSKMVDYSKIIETLEFAASTLRPITREQVAEVWRGEWEEERFAGEHEGWQHRECGRHSTEKTKWCPKCGKAMTDKAVDMVMERLEALKDEKG